jgi:hypothetical protein
MATHDKALVDRMRRRVIELDKGEMIRDQVRGVYGIDEASRSSARLLPLRRQRDVVQPLAQPHDDDRRRPHRRGLAVVGGIGVTSQTKCRPGVPQWQQGTRVTVWMEPTASTGEIANVQTQLHNLPIVKKCQFRTQGAGLR